jgi:hypothetical protein
VRNLFMSLPAFLTNTCHSSTLQKGNCLMTALHCTCLQLDPSNAHCLSLLHFWNYIQMPSAFLYKFHFIPHFTLSKIISVQATALHLGIYLISGFTCPLQGSYTSTWIEQLKQKINLPKDHAIFCLHPLQKKHHYHLTFPSLDIPCKLSIIYLWRKAISLFCLSRWDLPNYSPLVALLVPSETLNE